MRKEPTNIQACPTILVVDKSPIIRKGVQTTLEQEHIRVLTADNALSAFTSVIEENPAVIFLDTHLPHMSGFRVCQILRKNLQLRQIPVILLIEKNGLFNKMRGRLAGVTDYLMKPLESAELVETAKKYLRKGPEAMP